MKNINLRKGLTALLLAAGLFLGSAACGTASAVQGAEAAQTTAETRVTAAETVTETANVTASAQTASYEAANATAFTFTDGGITAADGAYTDYSIEGTALSISGSGTYILSGSCADGSVKVKKGAKDVTLVLDGLTLSSSATAPITCGKSSAVTIIAANGSESTLTDSEKNNDETYPDNLEAENAVIKCKDGSQVTICGGGTLNIVSNGKNGVKSGATTDEEGEAWLTVKELTLNITTTVNDALSSEATLNVLSGTLSIAAADDAICSDYVLNIGAEGTDGPTINISSSYEGLEAATLNVYSGSVTLHAEDDGVNAANSDLTDYSYACNIYGGKLYIDVANGDGIDSNGTLSIYGGEVEIYSSEQSDNSPLDSDGAFTLEGGTVLAVGMGNMSQTPSSTGQAYISFGAGGGFGAGGFFGGQRPDGQTMPDGGEPPALPDGQAPADGTTPPALPDGQAPADGTTPPALPDGQATADGTTPPALPDGQRPDFRGGADGQTPADMPTPPDGQTMPDGGRGGFFGGQDMQSGGSAISVKAGDSITILDSSGSTVYSAKAVRSANYVFFSSAALKSGETYTLSINGTEAATAAASADGSGRGGFPGGGQRPDGSQTPPEADSAGFDDVSASAWYYPAVQFVSGRGLMNGVGNRAFDPNTSVSRAMTAAILYRMAGSPAVEYSAVFSDVADGTWYSDAVVWAAQSGVAGGYTDGSFRPSETISREQLAALLYRYAVKNGGGSASGELSRFSDAASVSAWAEEALKWATAAGVMNGDTSGRLNPLGGASRAELAQMLMNYTGV